MNQSLLTIIYYLCRQMETKILVTGASGFIGSFVVEEALRRGMQVWAGVRKSSSRAFLQDERINFLELDFSSREQLADQLRGHEFDYIVHAAGVTKCLHHEDFYRVNTQGTRHFIDALLDVQMPIKRFVFISSLSVYGPIREQQPYEEITEDDQPRPNTAYGKSKLEAERYLESVGNQLPFIILRPTGVYGPRERDYFLMAKSIQGHTDFAVGFRQQDITFIYVSDVVQAVFLAFNHGMNGRKYFLSDGQVYRSSAFSNYIHDELGRPWWIRLTAPIWILRLVTLCGEYAGRIQGRVSALNNDKYHILRQRNWRCNIEPAIDELGFQPKVELAEGVRRTIAWYKENNWL